VGELFDLVLCMCTVYVIFVMRVVTYVVDLYARSFYFLIVYCEKREFVSDPPLWVNKEKSLRMA